MPEPLSKPIYVLNGPNLNLLGVREPHIYGTETLKQIRGRCQARAKAHGLEVVFRQSNREGELVDWVQEARTEACAIVINPAAYSHTSVALLDAIKAVALPAVELHLSNPAAREDFRRHSYVSQAVTGVIAGFGAAGYELAIDAAVRLLAAKT